MSFHSIESVSCNSSVFCSHRVMIGAEHVFLCALCGSFFFFFFLSPVPTSRKQEEKLFRSNETPTDAP